MSMNPNGDDDDGELRRGLAMMEEALGAPSDGGDDDEKMSNTIPNLMIMTNMTVGLMIFILKC
jgi:hypothetical protein